MKQYLVSIIECAVNEDNNFFTDFRLFNTKKEAEAYYANNLKEFLAEKGEGYDWYDSDDERTSTYHLNTYTWEMGENHWEIQLTELDSQE